jgi:hypothetical protein
VNQKKLIIMKNLVLVTIAILLANLLNAQDFRSFEEITQGKEIIKVNKEDLLITIHPWEGREDSLFYVVDVKGYEDLNITAVMYKNDETFHKYLKEYKHSVTNILCATSSDNYKEYLRVYSKGKNPTKYLKNTGKIIGIAFFDAFGDDVFIKVQH